MARLTAPARPGRMLIGSWLRPGRAISKTLMHSIAAMLEAICAADAVDSQTKVRAGFLLSRFRRDEWSEFLDRILRRH